MLGRCSVLPWDEFSSIPAATRMSGATFFCRAAYDPQSGALDPIDRAWIPATPWQSVQQQNRFGSPATGPRGKIPHRAGAAALARRVGRVEERRRVRAWCAWMAYGAPTPAVSSVCDGSRRSASEATYGSPRPSGLKSRRQAFAAATHAAAPSSASTFVAVGTPSFPAIHSQSKESRFGDSTGGALDEEALARDCDKSVVGIRIKERSGADSEPAMSLSDGIVGKLLNGGSEFRVRCWECRFGRFAAARNSRAVCRLRLHHTGPANMPVSTDDPSAEPAAPPAQKGNLPALKNDLEEKVEIRAPEAAATAAPVSRVATPLSQEEAANTQAARAVFLVQDSVIDMYPTTEEATTQRSESTLIEMESHVVASAAVAINAFPGTSLNNRDEASGASIKERDLGIETLYDHEVTPVSMQAAAAATVTATEVCHVEKVSANVDRKPLTVAMITSAREIPRKVSASEKGWEMGIVPVGVTAMKIILDVMVTLSAEVSA